MSVTGRARATRYHLAGGRRALQELRSQLLHQRVAIRLVREPELLDQARRRLEHLRVVNPAGRAYHDRWEHLLNEDLAELLRIMSSAGPELDLLRKESPLTVLVRPEDRADLFRRTGLDEPPAA